MKNKKTVILIAAGMLIIALLAVILIPKVIKKQPDPSEEDMSFTRSAWLDESLAAEESTTDNEERTLPMVTVG